MEMSSRIVDAVQPDLVDINFGCPVKKVVCKGAGAGVLKDVDLMVRLTKAVIKGTNLPVTVKTRLGWDENSINIDEVAERLQDIGVQALTVHARTRAQMYKGHSDWTHIERVKNNPRITMPIFGNGDIDSPEKALEYKNKFGLDGMMIGRAAIGYPWIFNEIKHYFKTGEHLPAPTMIDRVEAARNHLTWSMDWKGERVGIVEMRRHYTNYFKGISNFKEHRLKLVTLENPEELFKALDEIQEVYADYHFV
jgi:tRNA-dihydrouridine synthase B